MVLLLITKWTWDDITRDGGRGRMMSSWESIGRVSDLGRIVSQGGIGGGASGVLGR